MSDDYQHQQRDLQLEAEQRRLREEEQRLADQRWNAKLNRVVTIAYSLVTALEVLLLLRFVLRLFGANPENYFASFIYTLSEPFVAPFSTLFISPTFNGGANIFDVNLLIAIFVYALLVFLVSKLVLSIGLR